MGAEIRHRTTSTRHYPSRRPILHALVLIASGSLGLCVGSFLNVLIARLPDPERTMFRPVRSACPCGRPVRAIENIPIASYLVMRGRCACAKRAPIGVRYPLVEGLVGAIFVGSVLAHGVSLAAVSAALFLTLLLGVAITDLRTFLIPDLYTIGGYVAGLALAVSASGVPEAGQLALDGLLAAFLLWLLGFTVGALSGKDALGFGDVLLVGMMGAFLGFGGTVTAIYLGAVSGLALYVVHRRTPDARIPFGLHLAIGAAAALLIGENSYTDYVNALLPWY